MKQEEIRKKSFFERFIKGIEYVGNKLPHPFWLFVLLIVVTVGASWFFSKQGLSVAYMAASTKAGEASKETVVTVVNLLDYDVIRKFLGGFVKNYMDFAPLGLVVVMMLGIGIVEQSGMISALMRKTIMGAPPYLITATLAFIGVNSNLASNAGSIFTPIIGAAVFKALGRNPIIGAVAGVAAASGGFTANLFVAGTDGLLAGITQSAAKAMNIGGPTHPLINWYFMAVATFLITIVTTVVTERFIVKLLGDEKRERDTEELMKHAVTPSENRGLFWAGIATVLYIGFILYHTIPEGSLFRAKDGSLLPSSPLLSSIMAIIFFFFFFVGIAYGYGAGCIKRSEDIPKMMQKGLAGSLSFLIVAFPAAYFINLFDASNFTIIIASKGAAWLQKMNLGGIPLLLMFILLCTCVNLFITSGSAKWLILAPIFVPMFGVLGFSPALTQVAYRIGDSCTNIISPLHYTVPVMLGLLEQYRKESDPPAGIGTVLSLGMPYSIAFILSFSGMLILWYLLNLPLGPGAGVFL